jgi:hypothetical protein
MTLDRIGSPAWFLLSFLLGVSCAGDGARAQSVDLGIVNIQQGTPVWCWAAVAEQVIRWKNHGPGPSQCQLVSMANGFPPQTCCAPPNAMVAQACLRTGWLQEIQALIAHFGGSHSAIAPPAHPAVLFQTLQAGRAVILGVQTTPYSGHVVVLRGMIAGPDPLLIINDPMRWSGFSQPVPMSQLMSFWNSAIVVD